MDGFDRPMTTVFYFIFTKDAKLLLKGNYSMKTFSRIRIYVLAVLLIAFLEVNAFLQVLFAPPVDYAVGD